MTPTPEQAAAVRQLLAMFSREELARMATAENCRRSLATFVRHAWHVIEPHTQLRWNWHIEAICQALEAVSRGQIRRLVINIPPGHMKSILVSVLWPAWEWTWAPHRRLIFASYDQDLSNRDSVKTRSVLQSRWYQETFKPSWQLAGDQNVKSLFENTAKGVRQAISTGGAGTGFRGDVVVVDDPINVNDAHNEGARQKALRWWTKAMPTRVNDPATGAFVIVMQRLHEGDLSGEMLVPGGGYTHLCLPSEYDPEIPCACGLKPCSTGPLGKLDPRTQRGELLFPSMFTAAALAELKSPTALGPLGYAGQHDQRPAPAGGNMFKKTDWRFWRHPWEPEIPELAARTVILPAKFDRTALSWDCTFGKTDGSDLVAGGAWSEVGANLFLRDLRWKRMDFNETEKELLEQVAQFPDAREKFVELAANGPAIVNRLKDKVPGLVGVKPAEYGSKIARAVAGQPRVAANQVYIPLHAKWRDEYTDQHAQFPNGAHDDAVDQQSQLLLRWDARTDADRLRKVLRAL